MNNSRIPFEETFKWKYQNCLFRYRGIGNEEDWAKNISALENDRLYFSSPLKFNDPFDNLIYANIETLLSEVADNLNYGMDDYLERLKERDMFSAFIGHNAWNGPERDKMIDHYFNMIVSVVGSIKKSIRTNSKVICFSELFDSMLMWSHYAEDHQGYALIYTVGGLKDSLRYTVEGKTLHNNIYLEKVKYVPQQVDLTEYIGNYIRSNVLDNMGDVEMGKGKVPQHILRQAITEKSEEWEYEKEWRLIPRIIDLENPSPLGYIECIPVGIILGAHCSDENSRQIINICREKEIHVYRMFLNEFSPVFRLNIGEGENI